MFLARLVKLVWCSGWGASGSIGGEYPLSVGLIAGYVLAIGPSLVVDCIRFMGQGHQVHWW